MPTSSLRRTARPDAGEWPSGPPLPTRKCSGRRALLGTSPFFARPQSRLARRIRLQTLCAAARAGCSFSQHMGHHVTSLICTRSAPRPSKLPVRRQRAPSRPQTSGRGSSGERPHFRKNNEGDDGAGTSKPVRAGFNMTRFPGRRHQTRNRATVTRHPSTPGLAMHRHCHAAEDCTWLHRSCSMRRHTSPTPP
jgi:hypothetical protein